MKQLLCRIVLLGALGFSWAAMSESSAAADAPPTTNAAAAPPPASGSTSAGTTGSASGTAPAHSPAQAAAAPSGPVFVQVVTSLGNFTIELFTERAPLTVAHFLKSVDSGFYTNTIFHRVIPNFVIQGGGFDTNYQLKSVTSKVFNESGNGLTNQRGTVGMARSSEPHGGDVQFYVNLFDNAALDPNQTRWGYAVFGRIAQGMEVVDKIGNVATGAHAPFKEDAPLKPVIIERIERVPNPN